MSCSEILRNSGASGWMKTSGLQHRSTCARWLKKRSKRRPNVPGERKKRSDRRQRTKDRRGSGGDNEGCSGGWGWTMREPHQRPNLAADVVQEVRRRFGPGCCRRVGQAVFDALNHVVFLRPRIVGSFLSDDICATIFSVSRLSANRREDSLSRCRRRTHEYLKVRLEVHFPLLVKRLRGGVLPKLRDAFNASK